MAKLYPISPPKIDLPKFKEQLKSVLDRPDIGLFQLRLKDISDSEFLKAAEELLPICNAAKVPFLINDSAEIAVKCGADGLHIGEDDGAFEHARSLLGGGKIIGVSCYNSIERASKMAQLGADYISFGAFFPTTTKIPKTKADISVIHEWKKTSKTPCSVIGGINFENKETLEKAGADYICMISAIWS